MRKAFLAVLALAVTLWLPACTRRSEDRLDQGQHGAVSPAESGQHGADAYNRPPFGRDQQGLDKQHQTAGLTPELTNDKSDVTMEGSGNLAWQGSYEREKRAKAQDHATATP